MIRAVVISYLSLSCWTFIGSFIVIVTQGYGDQRCATKLKGWFIFYYLYKVIETMQNSCVTSFVYCILCCSIEMIHFICPADKVVYSSVQYSFRSTRLIHLFLLYTEDNLGSRSLYRYKRKVQNFRFIWCYVHLSILNNRDDKTFCIRSPTYWVSKILDKINKTYEAALS